MGQASNKTVDSPVASSFSSSLEPSEPLRRLFIFPFLFINCYFCIEALGHQLSSPSLCPLFLNVFPSGVPVPTRDFKPKYPNLAALSVEDRRPARPLSTRCPAHPTSSSSPQSMCLEAACSARLSSQIPLPLFGGLCESLNCSTLTRRPDWRNQNYPSPL